MTAHPADPETSPTSAPEWSGLVDTARRVGHHVWVERQLFAWLGESAGVAAGPAVAVFLGEQASRHGWHAELLFERLPQVGGMDPEELVRSGGHAVGAVIGAACRPVAGDVAVQALAGHCRVVLPALIESYRSLMGGASEVADGSLVRSLRMVVTDDLDEWQRGDALVRRVVTDPSELREVLDHQSDLELLMMECDRFPG
jgi:hypothetical protein